MKHVLLTITLLLVTVTLTAQDVFTLTMDGFTNAKQPDQDYVVLEFEGKSQTELYTAFLNTITTMYISAKDVVSKVENETISLNGYSQNAIKPRENSSKPYYFDVSYSISFQFKDGKVRVNMPTVIQMPRGANNLIITGTSQVFTNSIAIYKNDKLKLPVAKASLEGFFNSLVSKIESSVKNNKTSEW